MPGKQRPSRQLDRQRHLLLLAAGRLLAEDASLDAEAALRKAVRQTGILDPAARPSIDEVLAAGQSHARLFGRPSLDAQPRWQAAAEAMQALAAFDPRLCDTTAGPDAPLQLHLHTDTPESVAHWLDEQRIPASPRNRRIALDRERLREVVTWEFQAGAFAVELWILPASALRQSPLHAGSGQPIVRLSPAAVRARAAGAG